MSNRVIELLNQSKENLLERNNELSYSVEDCYKRINKFNSKIDENKNTIAEIEQAITKLETK